MGRQRVDLHGPSCSDSGPGLGMGAGWSGTGRGSSGGPGVRTGGWGTAGSSGVGPRGSGSLGPGKGMDVVIAEPPRKHGPDQGCVSTYLPSGDLLTRRGSGILVARGACRSRQSHIGDRGLLACRAIRPASGLWRVVGGAQPSRTGLDHAAQTRSTVDQVISSPGGRTRNWRGRQPE
jgi:hypothetical protein